MAKPIKLPFKCPCPRLRDKVIKASRHPALNLATPRGRKKGIT